MAKLVVVNPYGILTCGLLLLVEVRPLHYVLIERLRAKSFPGKVKSTKLWIILLDISKI
jgi:hypothetical protein